MGLPRIERLLPEHKIILKGFQNQEPSLVEYIKRYALRHMQDDHLSWTFLAIDTVEKSLAGYFTLTAVSVERSLVDTIEGLSKLPRFPIPGILLARLAVDDRVQGQGLGRYLFEQALGFTLEAAVKGPFGVRLFVTDAINETAERFYTHFGMKPLAQLFPKRMVLDLKHILKARS